MIYFVLKNTKYSESQRGPKIVLGEIVINCMDKNCLLESILKYSKEESHKPYIYVWNDIKRSKWWQNLILS